MPPPNTPAATDEDADDTAVRDNEGAPVLSLEDVPAVLPWTYGTSSPQWPAPIRDNPEMISPIVSSTPMYSPPPTDAAPNTPSTPRANTPPPPTRSPEECEMEWPIDWQGLEYIDMVDENLHCSICRTPFHKPVSTNPCGHVFCSSCLDQYLHAIQPRNGHRETPCPICRTPLTYNPWSNRPSQSLVRRASRPCDRVLTAMLGQLRVKCPNDPRLCAWTGPRSDIEGHMRRHCEYTRVRCVMRDCDQLVHRGAQEKVCLHVDTRCTFCDEQFLKASEKEHLALDCTKVIEACMACGAAVAREDLAEHQEACLDEPTACEFAVNGCSARDTRRALYDHERSCVYGQLSRLEDRLMGRMIDADTLRQQNSQMTRQLAATSATLGEIVDRLAALERENLSLKATVEMREHAMQPDFSEAVRGGLLAEFDTRATELLQHLNAQDARQFVMMQSRLMPLEESQHELNTRIASLDMQVRWLRSMGRIQQRQNTFGAMSGEASGSTPEPAAASRGASVAPGSPAAERYLSDQIDRARM
ncbi:hypothetical protein M406DRAFT_329403 [Cryphonectria parasitica EP155]|uniref:RING-type domain-containing protein n=1 Tax=Cryphonectria parasitica (strain ATCC 38755 / EP155) TaxID=660469 RepID=A0A9P5CPJ6_CRYP1|nr:uncharacterized protein M406DRAFT_329403 [Cryphonectria parasitica EP155]KAF3765497.1 hypothetical protein M406DRAFT_329403 [Cryphonectria parasitica EP155]